MARALRIERFNGRYHVAARGNERKDIFRDDTDRFHFLELLGMAGEHLGARVHAYVLMDNHYHLLLETERHGDWGRDASLWLGRRTGRMTLAQLGEAAGGLDYAVVSKSIARFGHRLSLDLGLRQQLVRLEQQLSK